MRRFRGCQLSLHIKLPNIYEGMIDTSVKSTRCELKLVVLECVFSLRVDSGCLYTRLLSKRAAKFYLTKKRV